MNKRDRLIVCRYIRATSEALELADWKILLATEPAKEGTYATITPAQEKREARMYLCPEFRNLDARMQVTIIAHELIHCHLHPSSVMVTHDLRKHLGEQSWDLFSDHYLRDTEYATEALAQAFTPLLPLIDWENG